MVKRTHQESSKPWTKVMYASFLNFIIHCIGETPHFQVPIKCYFMTCQKIWKQKKDISTWSLPWYGRRNPLPQDHTKLVNRNQRNWCHFCCAIFVVFLMEQIFYVGLSVMNAASSPRAMVCNLHLRCCKTTTPRMPWQPTDDRTCWEL